MISSSPGASAQAIQKHYDIGNEFYRLWLGDSLVYSSGIWKPNESYDALELAQIRKLDYHVNQARAAGAKKILDVGCGWGSLLKRLVENHGCDEAVGLTLSNEQAHYISTFQNPKIKVLIENWADHKPQDNYDAIISIGAFEHFARPDYSSEEKTAGYRKFFLSCHKWLKRGGWMSLQTASQGKFSEKDKVIFPLNEILPETELPRLAEIVESTERIFEIVKIRNDRMDYAQTFRAWLKNFKTNRKIAIQMVGKEIVDLYDHYLHVFVFAFETGRNDLLRITLRRIDESKV